MNSHWLPHSSTGLLAACLAAMAEAAADTVSSEIGQVFGGRPRMITTLKPVDPGIDGGITLAGSSTGIAAAAIVAALGSFAVHPDLRFFVLTARRGRLRPILRQFSWSYLGTVGLAQQRRGQFSVDGECERACFLVSESVSHLLFMRCCRYRAAAVRLGVNRYLRTEPDVDKMPAPVHFQERESRLGLEPWSL